MSISSDTPLQAFPPSALVQPDKAAEQLPTAGGSYVRDAKTGELIAQTATKPAADRAATDPVPAPHLPQE